LLSFPTLPEKANPMVPWWELAITRTTLLGPLKAGLGGFSDDSPIWMIGLGVNLDLVATLRNSRI